MKCEKKAICLRAAWVGIVVLVGLLRACEANVGVWIDDGFGRTVLADKLDADEAADLADDMLELLDLPAPPAQDGRHHHHRHPLHAHASAPTWLRGIYDTLDEHGQATSPQMDELHRETVTAADTIITFVIRDPPEGRPSHGGNKRLYFDMSEVPLDHTILAAEIMVYRHPSAIEPLTLHVYAITDSQGSEQQIAQVNTTEPGWMSVNVTAPVLSWLLFPNTNHGLRLAVTSVEHKHERHFHEVGISGAHDEEEHRPFMVGYFGLPENPTFKKKKKRKMRRARSVASKARSRQRFYRDVAEQQTSSETMCQMRQLHVCFRDLGWENWVIAPEGYDANYCEGRCVFPLQADMNATNHALVQTLVKVINGVTDDNELPPNPSCAPIDLATIPVLYYSFENNIVLKKYPKMIVKTCGCL